MNASTARLVLGIGEEIGCFQSHLHPSRCRDRGEQKEGAGTEVVVGQCDHVVGWKQTSGQSRFDFQDDLVDESFPLACLELDLEKVMSPEEKKKLYEAIGYDENNTSTSAYPTDVSELLPDVLNVKTNLDFLSLVHRYRSGHSTEDARREYLVENQSDRHAVSKSSPENPPQARSLPDIVSLLVLQFQTLA